MNKSQIIRKQILSQSETSSPDVDTYDVILDHSEGLKIEIIHTLKHADIAFLPAHRKFIQQLPSR